MDKIYRIGIGYDIHRLVKNKKLILGGVEIYYKYGCRAHSDGDVLIHAIIDAMLGAINLGDIGSHFPDNDPAYKDIASVELLKKTIEICEPYNYKISNIDSIIILEKPKLAPYIEMIQKNLCNILNISKDKLSIKAKTNEKLDSIGRGKSIAAYCIVLLEKI
ncbi:MAG: 2-C-methyl-D-erythritol 2,4-cyclodiphosphate synthase [Bacteroidales bacterium]|nr:2-C-methyl-D-erythritol 2,4-cyclodiphosphate synthase [Bacteroidales bacterium]MDD3755743.1 2-C-methyl-D-erythritol 2,4-cyclodiphosphate synthase [Bacteroidales bacterium]MDY0401515.1 2-C-methyl-D-erythritol 2,4-cyclodiphosphate synthase [Bacteroidales bacterium]HOB77302.1 2-C-methyl-D-erythritol 2,4-cyclodiphosphate synthase [Bacteroidales bacterium]HPZ61528.1 2-C-methyl-D-erythritol 2,4-cyclodiphosphate synthase [Bacteroidales bacterium]